MIIIVLIHMFGTKNSYIFMHRFDNSTRVLCSDMTTSDPSDKLLVIKHHERWTTGAVTIQSALAEVVKTTAALMTQILR